MYHGCNVCRKIPANHIEYVLHNLGIIYTCVRLIDPQWSPAHFTFYTFNWYGIYGSHVICYSIYRIVNLRSSNTVDW